MRLFEVRCSGVPRRFGQQPSCRQLLFKVSEESEGHIEIKCPRCKLLNRLEVGVMSYSTGRISYG